MTVRINLPDFCKTCEECVTCQDCVTVQNCVGCYTCQTGYSPCRNCYTCQTGVGQEIAVGMIDPPSMSEFQHAQFNEDGGIPSYVDIHKRKSIWWWVWYWISFKWLKITWR